MFHFYTYNALSIILDQFVIFRTKLEQHFSKRNYTLMIIEISLKTVFKRDKYLSKQLFLTIYSFDKIQKEYEYIFSHRVFISN